MSKAPLNISWCSDQWVSMPNKVLLEYLPPQENWKMLSLSIWRNKPTETPPEHKHTNTIKQNQRERQLV